MTLDEQLQVLACARVNGYDIKNYGDIDLHLSNGEIEIKRPKYTFENGAIYLNDPGYCKIYNSTRFYQFAVTDDMFKQWQRDYKLKQILK